MNPPPVIRPAQAHDWPHWLPLWQAYNAFYGRAGATALPEGVTQTTWARFLDAAEPVHALVAERRHEGHGELLGLAHYLFHPSTTRLGPTCYLQDLYTAESQRGQGLGGALIEAVAERARSGGAESLYWQTHETNATAMRLYERVASRSGFIVYRRELT